MAAPSPVSTTGPNPAHSSSPKQEIKAPSQPPVFQDQLGNAKAGCCGVVWQWVQAVIDWFVALYKDFTRSPLKELENRFKIVNAKGSELAKLGGFLHSVDNIGPDVMPWDPENHGTRLVQEFKTLSLDIQTLIKVRLESRFPTELALIRKDTSEDACEVFLKRQAPSDELMEIVREEYDKFNAEWDALRLQTSS